MAVTPPREQVTGLLKDAFFTGPGSAGLEDTWYPIAINGRGFLPDLDPSLGYFHEWQRTSVPLLNTQQAQSGGDQAQIPPSVWRRNVESWEQGSGQARLDRDTSLPLRFSKSSNINCWDPWKLSLLNATKRVLALPPGNVLMSKVGASYLWVSVGNQSWWFTALDNPPTQYPLGSVVVDVTTDGQNLYTIDTAGVVLRWTGPGASSTFATVTGFDSSRGMIRFTKGFLVVGNGPQLLDITSGTARPIYTHPLTGFTWVDSCEGLSVTYFVGGMGDKWNVWSATIKADATIYDPPKVAAPIPDGEIAYNIASYLGYVLLGTSTGWRFGTPDSTGSITFGRLVSTDAPVRCFEGQDRFVWYGQSSVAGSVAKLGRTDLSTFVASVTPAAASDIESTATAGEVRNVVTWGAGAQHAGRRAFSVDGDGIWVEDITTAAYGWLEQGAMAFNSTDPKQGLYAQLYHSPLDGTVSVDIRFEDGAWAPLGTNSNSGTTQMGNMPVPTAFHHAELRYRLYPNPISNGSPVLNRMEFRVLPISGRATQWRLPIVCHEKIHHRGVTKFRDVSDDYDFLDALVRSRQPFTYRQGSQHFTLFATDFMWLPRNLTQDGDTFEGTYSIIAQEIG